VQRAIHSEASSEHLTTNNTPVENEIVTYGIADYIYDPEFSEPSTPAASDSDDTSDIPPDPEIIARVHPCFRKPPVLPGVDFRWTCPVEECAYVIDMLKPSDANTWGLRGEDVRALSGPGKRWSHIDEALPESAFYQMVSNHWQDHLTLSGVKWVREGTRTVTCTF
jgi:hypothetical protein